MNNIETRQCANIVNLLSMELKQFAKEEKMQVVGIHESVHESKVEIHVAALEDNPDFDIFQRLGHKSNLQAIEATDHQEDLDGFTPAKISFRDPHKNRVINVYGYLDWETAEAVFESKWNEEVDKVQDPRTGYVNRKILKSLLGNGQLGALTRYRKQKEAELKSQ